MCGIAILQAHHIHARGTLVEKMLSQIEHRGSSLYEIGQAGSCSLGTNRLEILDPEAGRQPMWNEDRSVLAVLNGEIYNHIELRKRLQSLGHSFAGHCDTEVLVHAFEEWGPSCITRLDGMFALAIYDVRRDELLVARDPFGIKPLYAAISSDFIAFASELKCFRSLPKSKWSSLPPGSLLWKGRLIKYYSPISRTPPVRFDEAVRAVRKRLSESVLRHTDVNLPVAVFVSGGIDSAILLALAARSHPNVTGITVGFENAPDLAAAKSLCALLGVPHIAKEINRTQLLAHYERVIFHLESFEPNLVRAGLFTYLMAEVAHDHGFRVALAGEGSDEQFAGYRDFAALTSEALLQKELRDFFGELHRTQLLRWDKIGMANAIEVRVPYMDRALVETVSGLPTHFKLQPTARGIRTKSVLRAAFADVLPQDIRERDKIPMDEGAVVGGAEELSAIFGTQADAHKMRIDAMRASQYYISSDEERYNCNLFLERYAEFDPGSRVKVRRFGGVASWQSE